MTDQVDGTKWTAAVLVAVFGGIGGVVAWIWSIRVETPPGSADMADIAVSVFLGAIAGFVSIYAIKIDPSRVLMHSLALALLSGFAWKPVLEAGRELVITNVQQGEVAEQIEVARNTMNDLESAGPDEAPTFLGALESISKSLMRSAESVRSPALRAEIDKTLVETVGAMSEATNIAPEEGARVLGSIGASAVRENRTAIATAAETALVRVAQDEDLDVGTSSEVSNALLRLSAAERADQREDTAAALREKSHEVFKKAEIKVSREHPEKVQELRRRSIVARESPPPE